MICFFLYRRLDDMKKKTKRLNLSRETVAVLDPKHLEGIAVGAIQCQESYIICSIMHTCASCKPEEQTTTAC
jgi:hypothetical protein